MTGKQKEPSWFWPWGLLRGYLVIGSLILAFGFLVYTQSVVNRVERQGNAVVRILRRLLESEAADTTQAEISNLAPLFREICAILQTNLPVVVTDQDGHVLFTVGVPAAMGSLLAEQPAHVIAAVKAMDRMHGAIPLRSQTDGQVLGYLHWGEHKVLRELRWIPPLEVAIVGLFVLIGLLGLRRLKAVEQRSLWFGMAREAAHQLGTPITSLLGWVQLLKEHEEDSDTTVGVEDIAQEMEQDIDRLAKIARRFERIGHPPHLEIMDVHPLLEETAMYFRARLPRQGEKVAIREEYAQLAPVMANRDLLTWVLENLVRNSLEALGGTGEIVFRASMEPNDRGVCIQIEDTGHGMTGRVQSRAFRPGFSTKERGWGLGLAMARRIVEEYHGGKLKIVRSRPTQGTLVAIVLPAAVREKKR